MNTYQDPTKGTILVVDDNPTNLNVLSDCLTNFGFTVLLKKDGGKALELIQRKMPDLILLDVIMPGLDGFETCRRLKAEPHSKDIPIIFMTALSDPVDKVRGFELGAVDYITKPFHQEEVLARVKAHLTIQNLQKDLQAKNKTLHEALERERKLVEDLRLNLSIALPHELRTPLNAILGYSEILSTASPLPDAETIIEFNQTIHHSALRLHRLVENSLLYAHLKLLKYTPREGIWQSDYSLDLNTFLPAAARQIAEGVGRTEDLRLELTPAHVKVHPKNFSKILNELLMNAFKFSEEGSPVTIKTTLNGNLCLVSITDRGRGMSNGQIADIGAYMQFDRHVHEQQGTGLGLTIAYLLTHLEGGVLSIDSEPQKGTTVSIVFSRDMHCQIMGQTCDYWFEADRPELSHEEDASSLPQITGYTRLPAPPQSSGTAILGNDKEDLECFRIIVIDDTQANREAIKTLLEPLGFDVTEASNPYEGLQKVRAVRPHLALFDTSLLEQADLDFPLRLQQHAGPEGVTIFMVSPGNLPSEQYDQSMSYCHAIFTRPLSVPALLHALEVHLGLEWDYQGEQMFPVPPQEELEELYKLVTEGNIRAIFDALDSLEQQDPAYRPVISKLRRFADSFQIQSLRQIIHKYLNF